MRGLGETNQRGTTMNTAQHTNHVTGTYYTGLQSLTEMKRWEDTQKQWNDYFWFNEENMRARIYKAYLVFRQLVDERPKIFFSGTRTRGTALLHWKIVWFFTHDYAMKMENVSGEDKYTLIPLRNNVTTLTLDNRPCTAGMLSVEITLDDGSRHTLEAWDRYTEVLRDVILDYLKPNMKMARPPQQHQMQEARPVAYKRVRRQKPFRLTT